VRPLLLTAEGRELPFADELLATFTEAVIKTVRESDVRSLVGVTHGQLIVIARDAWKDDDTELCKRLYGERLGVPLLCVAGPSSMMDRAAALRGGADEFLSIPFEAEELVVRAHALVRRASSGPRSARAGPFLVDLGRRQISVDGRIIALTLREFDVLSALIERTGEVVSRQELAARIASTAGRESNIVDVHVSRIREKLGEHAGSIETVRGTGYRFRES
jgi:DNA-binding response OmpR family regulator